MFNILVTTEVSTDAITEVITTQHTTKEETTLPPTTVLPPVETTARTTGLEIENYLERIKTVFNIYLLLLSLFFQRCLCFVMKCFGWFSRPFSDNDCKVRFIIYLCTLFAATIAIRLNIKPTFVMKIIFWLVA